MTAAKEIDRSEERILAGNTGGGWHSTRGGSTAASFVSAEHAWKILRLRGSPEEMGRQHGELMRSEIAYTIDAAVYGWAGGVVGLNLEELRIYARLAFSRLSPRHQRELTGVAEGAGLPLDDILSWNFVDDFWESLRCSAFAAFGEMTRDGRVVVGRNNDYPDDGTNKVSVTILREPVDGLPTLCNTWAGTVGTYEGVNRAGLVIGTQFSPDEQNTQGELPVKILNLEVLERCGEVEHAARLVRGSSRDFGCNLLVATERDCVVLECSSDQTVVRRPVGGAIVSTNHYGELRLSGPQKKDSHLTEERHDYLQAALRARHGAMDVEAAKQILSTGVVRREMAHPEGFTTRTAVYEPAHRSVDVAHGRLPAMDGPFLRIELLEWLGGEVGLINEPYPVE